MKINKNKITPPPHNGTNEKNLAKIEFALLIFFHQLGPLGRVGLAVTESVCLFVCLCVPFPCDFF